LCLDDRVSKICVFVTWLSEPHWKIICTKPCLCIGRILEYIVLESIGWLRSEASLEFLDQLVKVNNFQGRGWQVSRYCRHRLGLLES
jgi:hypothetical protein